MTAIEPEWKPVKLAAKVIGHISQGMYRSPAGAIKELVCNAYDAGADYAKLHTGFPKFADFSCLDNGSGIEKTEFFRLMEGGIGDSGKRTSAESNIGVNQRPIIGRLGVGILSLAQICTQFTIRSHHRASKTAFEAEIKFPPYTRKEIDKLLTTKSDQPIKGGEYKVSTVPFDEEKCGVFVTTSHMRDGYKKLMSSLENYLHRSHRRSNRSYPNFSTFLDCIANPRLRSLYFSSQYDQLIFGLSLASPLPYESLEDGGPLLLNIPPLKKLNDQLTSYNFRVELDNIELRRPLRLPSNSNRVKPSQCTVLNAERVTFTLKDGKISEEVSVDKYSIEIKDSDETFQLYYFTYDNIVNGYPLKFSGYIFLQTTRLFPKEYQGILIRIRNVAIGQYDGSVMTYPTAEGPRFSMLSSEVFIEDGLDDALKVDRDGFNTLDPHYIRLQSFIHSILREKIFPGSWEEEKTRNTKRRVAQSKERESKFSKSLSSVTDGSFKRLSVSLEKPSSTNAPLVSLDSKKREIVVNAGHPSLKSVLGKKKSVTISSQVLAAFEIANKELTAERRREVFYFLIEGIFNE